MKCLVVCQPYASLIIEGIKDIENRTWLPVYRGPLAILAGKSREWINILFMTEQNELSRLLGCSTTDLPRGVILGTVELYDIGDAGTEEKNKWASGPICWLLRNPRKLVTPIPYRGQQGLFDVPDELFDGKGWQERSENTRYRRDNNVNNKN